MSSKFVVLCFFLSLCKLFNETVGIYFPTGEAKLREYPATVAIVAKIVSRSSLELVGTGTLLSPHYVLGYGRHYYTYERLYVLAGGLDWREKNCKTCQWREVVHKFNSRGEDRVLLDIYRVNEIFTATREVKFAQLSYALPRHGWLVHVAGWGHVYTEDYWNTPLLHWNFFNIIPIKQCKDTPNLAMWGDYFCMFSNSDPHHPSILLACDSGAPVYYRGKVIGVGVPLFNGTFMFRTVIQLGVYQEWISQTISWDGVTPNPNAIRMDRRLKYSSLSSGYGVLRRLHFAIGVIVSWLLSSIYCVRNISK